MAKKLLSLVLACLICLFMCSSVVLASTSSNVACYIATTDCPDEYLEYASENVSKYIMSLNESLEY